MKIKIELVKETSEEVTLKFPSIEVPVELSQRYFKKLEKSGEYEILKQEENLLRVFK